MNLQTEIKIWIRNQLADMGWGAKKRLADELGVTPTQLTKMLNLAPGSEHRAVRADEYVKIIKFFGKSPPEATLDGVSNEGKKQLIAIYDSVSPDLQKAILAMVSALADQVEKK